jgi:hypothetical protein
VSYVPKQQDNTNELLAKILVASEPDYLTLDPANPFPPKPVAPPEFNQPQVSSAEPVAVADIPVAEAPAAAPKLAGTPFDEVKKDPRYQKYFKMMKMGVPPQGAYQQMQMDEVDELVLESFRNALIPAEAQKPVGRQAQSPSSRPGDAKQGGGNTAQASKRRRSSLRMRRIHWNTMSADQVKGSVFGQRRTSLGVAPSQIALLEKLCVESDSKQEAGPSKKSGKGKELRVLRVLDPRRSQNILISAAQFKHLALAYRQQQEVKLVELRRVVHGDANDKHETLVKYRSGDDLLSITATAISEAVLGADLVKMGDKLHALVDAVPSPAEVVKVQRTKPMKGEVLGTAEHFLQTLLRELPRPREKAEALIFLQQFSKQSMELEASMKAITLACTQVVDSEKLAALLHAILEIGAFNITFNGFPVEHGSSGSVLNNRITLTLFSRQHLQRVKGRGGGARLHAAVLHHLSQHQGATCIHTTYRASAISC